MTDDIIVTVQDDADIYVFIDDGGDIIYVPGLEFYKGADGKSVELQKTATHIQWRLVGSDAWVNLVALADIVGATGRGIASVVRTSGTGAAGTTDTYTITFTDNTTTTFQVVNGANGTTATVVQTTGTSTGNVMSQKAATDSFSPTLFNGFFGGVLMPVEANNRPIGCVKSDNSYIYAHVSGTSDSGFRKFDFNGKLVARYAMDSLGGHHSFEIVDNYIFTINFGWSRMGYIVKLNKDTMQEVSSKYHSFMTSAYIEKSGCFTTSTGLLILWYDTKIYSVNQSTLDVTELTQFVGVQYVCEYYHLTAGKMLIVIDSTNGYILNSNLTIRNTKALPTGWTTIVQAVGKYNGRNNSYGFVYLVNSSRYVTTFAIDSSYAGGGSRLLPNNATRIFCIENVFKPSDWDDNALITNNGDIMIGKNANATVGETYKTISTLFSIGLGGQAYGKMILTTSKENSLWI